MGTPETRGQGAEVARRDPDAGVGAAHQTGDERDGRVGVGGVGDPGQGVGTGAVGNATGVEVGVGVGAPI